MAPTQQELEKEIARLSRFINRQLGNSQQLIQKMKPVIKRGQLSLQIAGLKAQLAVINQMIEYKRTRMKQEKEGREK